ncbi:MAG: glycosyltransferase family 2 protein [Anaerolineae bacterium]|jgi:glycosyltransferase involved in cell wall biosynthesis
MNEISILALIPAWNEGTLLGPVVRAAREHLPVLVVDDGSEDDTAAVAARAGASVVSHSENRGKGVALMTGFDWALSHGYDGVLTLDADGQHDPGDIPTFLEAYRDRSWDLIIGRRDFSKMPFPRGYTNPFGSWLLSLALKESIPDNQSGFRLHDRELLAAMDLNTAGFELEVEVIIEAVCHEMRIGWVDIRTIYDVDKTSYFHPVKDSARFLRMVWYAWRRRRAASASS